MRSLKLGIAFGVLLGSFTHGNAMSGKPGNTPHRSPSSWGADTSVNTPVCIAAGWQTAPVVIKDGMGGSIVFWQDQRKGTNISTTDFDIYAQRLDAAGEPRWTQNGIPIATDALFDLYPRAVCDGSGGAIVVWWTQNLALTAMAIRAQRIDSTGAVRWAPGGIQVDTYPNGVSIYYDVVSDGAGGVIIASSTTPVNTPEGFAQRIDSSGALRWGPHGVLLAPSGLQGQEVICAGSDGEGGAVVAMQDYRYPGTDSSGLLFMQRVDASGTLLWGQGSVAVSNHQVLGASILTHGPGDYVVAWLQRPRPNEPAVNRLAAQRLNGEGSAKWSQYGVEFTAPPAQNQDRLDICDDRRGGAIISWEESRNNIMSVYAQRLDSSGVSQWADSVVTLAPGSIFVEPFPQIVENGMGGAFVIWLDCRNETLDPTNVDIYGQCIGADGSLAWQAGGIAVTSAPKTQKFSKFFKRGIALIDTTGIVVVAWEDARDSTAVKGDPGQIYAARMVFSAGAVTDTRGDPGIAGGTFRLDQNYPNPFNPGTTIGYRLAVREHVSLAVYNLLGEKIATLVDEDQSPGEHTAVFNGTRFASGVYFYRLQAGGFVQTDRLLLVK